MRQRLWVIVLAGGEGRRLRGLALDERGAPAPKQFCSFGQGHTLLNATLARAEQYVPPERIVVSVTEGQRRWWSPMLADRPRITPVSQPVPKGTAVGVLLPLLQVLRRDPDACVLLMPSDHAVEDEDVVRESLEHAVDAARGRPRRVILLGHAPDRADPDLGWILPSDDGDGLSRGVAGFVEKPDPALAERLLSAGALWNMLLVAASGAALLDLYRRFLPELLPPLHDVTTPPPGTARLPSLDAAFERLPSRDIARDLFTPAVHHLRVVAVPSCGWTDLGTPERLACWQSGEHMASILAREVHDAA